MSENAKFHFELTGRIVEIMPTVTFDSGFKKRTIVIDEKGVDDKYPNPIPFQLTKDRCEEADKYHVGMTVTVKGWFNGRKWHNPNKNVDQFFCDMMIGRIECEKNLHPVVDNDNAAVDDAGGVPSGQEPTSDALPF